MERKRERERERERGGGGVMSCCPTTDVGSDLCV